MDPDGAPQVLAEEMRELAARIKEDPSDLNQALELAELFITLDAVLSEGRRLPKEWRK